ncbi:MAG TPA: hypothetical protein VIE65_12135 [Methylobacter sp.]|jgi:hypothetical protein
MRYEIGWLKLFTHRELQPTQLFYPDNRQADYNMQVQHIPDANDAMALSVLSALLGLYSQKVKITFFRYV